MLYKAIIVSIFSLFISGFSITVTHTDIGVIEDHSQNNNGDSSESSYQESVLRRRLLPGGFTDADKLIILNSHNKYRNLTARGLTPNQPSAANMNQLVWDAGLAKVAQNYSSKCIWGHNPNRGSDLRNYLDSTSFDYVNQYVGENLFISTGPETIDTILTGMSYWYNEYEYFTFGTIDGTGPCVSGQQCGHYTQLVWGNTRYVGCAYTKCPTVQNLPTFKNAILFACDYYFAGNYVDDYPYISGDTCSSCPKDRNTCNDGLCNGCPSRSWDTYCCEYCSSSSCSNAINRGYCNSPSTCTNGISQTITPSPTTPSPTTHSPTTHSPTTHSPTTAPPTSRPTTQSPTTQSPTTSRPTTSRPTTQSPTTQSPTTSRPTTQSPTTSHPTTQSPTSPEQVVESINGCCLAYDNRYTPFCSTLSSIDCEIIQRCYWKSSC